MKNAYNIMLKKKKNKNRQKIEMKVIHNSVEYDFDSHIKLVCELGGINGIAVLVLLAAKPTEALMLS